MSGIRMTLGSASAISSTDSEQSIYKIIKDWVDKFIHDVLTLKHGFSFLSNMGFALITEFLTGHMELKDLYVGLGAAALTIPYVIVKTLYELQDHGISMKENKTNGLKVIGMELLKKAGTLLIVCAIAVGLGYLNFDGLTYIIPSLLGMGTSYVLDKLDNAYGLLSHFKKHAENRDAELGINNKNLVDVVCTLIETLVQQNKLLATNTEDTENVENLLKNLANIINETNITDIISNFQEIKNKAPETEKAAIDGIISYLKTIQLAQNNQNERTVTGVNEVNSTSTQPSTSAQAEVTNGVTNQAFTYPYTVVNETNTKTKKIKKPADMPTAPIPSEGPNNGSNNNNSNINLNSITTLVRKISNSPDTNNLRTHF
jgi:hypothetical protein